MTRRALIYTGGAVLIAAASAAWLFSDTRAEKSRRLAVLLDWKQGRTVAEIRAGDGTMSFAAARAVGPDGRVISTETDPKKIAAIRKRAASPRLMNLTAIEGGETNSNLPQNCCDATFIRGVYHHLTHPTEIDASLLRALRPGGKLAVIDFPPSRFLTLIAPVKGIPANRGGHGIPQAVLIEELQHAGFKLSKIAANWPGNEYCAIFKQSNQK